MATLMWVLTYIWSCDRGHYQLVASHRESCLRSIFAYHPGSEPPEKLREWSVLSITVRAGGTSFFNSLVAVFVVIFCYLSKNNNQDYLDSHDHAMQLYQHFIDKKNLIPSYDKDSRTQMYALINTYFLWPRI